MRVASPFHAIKSFGGRRWPIRYCCTIFDQIKSFEFKRLFEIGDEVVVTYECTRTDGTRFRNTEVLTFGGDKLHRVEVYFGWNIA